VVDRVLRRRKTYKRFFVDLDRKNKYGYSLFPEKKRISEYEANRNPIY